MMGISSFLRNTTESRWVSENETPPGRAVLKKESKNQRIFPVTGNTYNGTLQSACKNNNTAGIRILARKFYSSLKT